MKKAKKWIKTTFIMLFASCIAFFGIIYHAQKNLPNNFQVTSKQDKLYFLKFPIKAVYSSDNITSAQSEYKIKTTSIDEKYTVDLKIFGFILIKTANVSVVDKNYVRVLGKPFGIKIYSKGVMVVGITEVDSETGLKNPAREAGIILGDIIESINGIEVTSNTEVAEIISESGGKEQSFKVLRNGKKITLTLRAVKSVSEGSYKAGIWVRDSSAGIGMATFYNPNTNVIAGLAHAICDSDTGEIIPLNSGELVDAEIIGIEKGIDGEPGELKGRFCMGKLGRFSSNDVTGVYGNMTGSLPSEDLVEVALKQKIVIGDAQILTTINGQNPKLYSCKIERVHFNDESLVQNMVIKITDDQLLEKTGGIVQGMSGSPIMQDGKLVGAISHVFVNDCTRGYAIFAENMLETSESVAEEKMQNAS